MEVLQRLMRGVIALVLRQQEARCSVIRSIAQEFLTCLVMQPILKLASPGYVLIVYIVQHSLFKAVENSTTKKYFHP